MHQRNASQSQEITNQDRQNAGNNSDPLIVGADIGSTSFMVAFRSPGAEKIEIVSDWLGYDPQCQENGTNALPTCLYYPPFPRRWPYWQREVNVEKCSPDYDANRVIEFWKAGLYPGTPLYSEVAAAACRIGVPVERFPWDFTILLLNTLFFMPNAIFKGQAQSAVLAFSKPSSWLPEWFDVFVEAAVSLGFRRTQIAFVSETEALVRQFMKEISSIPLRNRQLPLFKEGDVAIVVDAGGYTVDMEGYIVERFKPGASHETRIGPAGPANSIRQGSETTWLAFADYMRRELRLKGDYSEDEIIVCLQQVKPEWRKKKTIFSMEEPNTPKYYNVQLIRADKDRSIPFLEGKFPITWAIAKTFFDLSINAQIQEIKKMMGSCPKNPSVLLVGGGYSALRYLRQRYKEAFEESDFKIKCHFASNPKPMIPNGLIDMWANPQITTSHILKDTYDITASIPYTKERQAEVPGTKIETYLDPDEQTECFLGHEFLGKMGCQVSQDETLTADTHLKRRCYAKKVDDLCWTEHIFKRKVDPGSADWLLPSNPLMQGPAETITLNIDLRKLLTSMSKLHHTSRTVGKDKRTTLYYVRYWIVLQLRGETVEYWIHFEERVSKSKIKIVRHQLNGDANFVNVATIQELGSCPRRIQDNNPFAPPLEEDSTETTEKVHSHGSKQADDSCSLTASTQLSGELALEHERALQGVIGNPGYLEDPRDLDMSVDVPTNFADKLQQALSQNRSIFGDRETQPRQEARIVTTPPHGGIRGRARRGLRVQNPNSTTPIGLPPKSVLSLLDPNRKRQAPEELETHAKLGTGCQQVKPSTADDASETSAVCTKRKAVRFH